MSATLGRTIAQRFWPKVSVTADTACWLWTGAFSSNGYGSIRIKQKGHNTHRIAWELMFGPIPAGMFVCHRCDVRGCVRPDHLFLGTSIDNIRDMMRKGRDYRGIPKRGSDVRTSKLTEDHVRIIKARLKDAPYGMQPTIARHYGVSTTVINNIANGKAWSWLT